MRHLLLLAERARNSPADIDGSQTLAGICRGIPWLGMVPEPSEAVINTLKRALAELEPGSEIVSLTLSALEPPSAMLTLRRAFPRISPTIESTPVPDLRKPLREVTYRIWDYEGTIRADVAALVAERFLVAAEAQRTRAVTILDSLAWLVLACPAMPEEVAALARELLLGGRGRRRSWDRRPARRGRWLRRRRASS